MSADWIIGALALVTIGGVLGLSVFHFGFYLKEPANMEAFKRIKEDRESATTKLSAAGADGRSLRQRLDAAPTIDDRLSPRSDVSLGIGTVLFGTKWSRISATLDGGRRSV